MPRKVKITAVSLPEDLVPEIAARMKTLRIRSRSEYFTKLAEKDVTEGGPFTIPVVREPAAKCHAKKK